jgi:CheY-like chemotaxis protein
MNALTPKSILVVDDEPSVANTLSLLLMIDKHRVEVAADGEQALAKYKEGNYDLVITDFLMPGIDGLELARLIKARSPQQPILLVTGHMETVSNSGELRLQHVEALLGKPFSLQQLQQAVRGVFPHG